MLSLKLSLISSKYRVILNISTVVYSMTYSMTCSMMAQCKKKDKKVAITLQENQGLNLENQYHKDAT